MSAVTDRFELIFDTLTITRKARNLARNPHIAFVVRGSAEGEEPDGQARLTGPGITYFRVKPQWLKYSNYRIDPPLIVELDAAELGRLP